MGISRGGGPGSYTYTATAPDKPVDYVSWYSAIRFANWMTDGDTENGPYTIVGGAANTSVTIPDATQRGAWAAAGPRQVLLTSEATSLSGSSRSSTPRSASVVAAHILTPPTFSPRRSDGITTRSPRSTPPSVFGFPRFLSRLPWRCCYWVCRLSSGGKEDKAPGR